MKIFGFKESFPSSLLLKLNERIHTSEKKVFFSVASLCFQPGGLKRKFFEAMKTLKGIQKSVSEIGFVNPSEKNRFSYFLLCLYFSLSIHALLYKRYTQMISITSVRDFWCVSTLCSHFSSLRMRRNGER